MNYSYYLYIIECAGFFKIGVSKTPQSRLSAIQTSTPFDVNTVSLMGFECKQEVYLAESLAHEMLTDLGYHERLEWFNCSADLALSTCETAAKRAKNICAFKKQGVRKAAIRFAQLFDKEQLSEITCMPLDRVNQIAEGKEPQYHEALMILKIKERL